MRRAAGRRSGGGVHGCVRGLADELTEHQQGRRGQVKFRLSETHILFKDFEEMSNSLYTPLKEKARGLMASRDMAFREALHEKLKEYVSTVSLDDIDRFLGDKSRRLEDRIEENKEVFKRLKDR